MFKFMDLKDVTPEDEKYIQTYGCCTGWEITNKYGIPSSYITRAIKNQKLRAVKKVENGFVLSRNYVVRDYLLEEFIEKHKKYDNEKITLSSHWKK